MNIGKAKVELLDDPTPDLSYLQPQPDDLFEERARKQGRLDALERGDWSPVGVVAKVRIGLDHGTALVQSEGIWGVESDDNLERHVQEQLESLRATLIELGFGRVEAEVVMHNFTRAF